MSDPQRSDDDLAKAWHTLSVRYHRLECDLDRALQSSHEISNSEFEVLELLAAADNAKMRMSELAGLVHLSQSALSRLVAGLEKDGLVERSMCAGDRRSVFTELTAEGRNRYDSAKPVQRAILRAEADGCTSGSLCGATELDTPAATSH
ncbi:DNA-binding MarR family transcriptional regulator [Williamsia limnetica]|jgi:DNA-binding MarR family transcriptional regulator|uniref:DNA-binding MarR family transcriptional regulator n=1 Tax=Williamsia limnetica TaxID=882452 RepID=A0A318RI51_WILLI|nr:MarR family transcriptional regulator [Williamsia limnetica]PYE14606.1 DNA-binding MarR family transcriptional regulator [Williamsia limnetica]